jgi:glycosyltransferase involved in cell wall biosynthesis
MVDIIRDAALNGLVTVVVPAYNASRFIERTLRSIQAQTYSKLEILVVDDGSTDNTADLARQYAEEDSRILVISNLKQGVSVARNRGIEIARGKYVAFIDANDLWHPTKIEKQMAVMASHSNDPGWAAVYVLSRVIDVDDYVIEDGPSRALGGFMLCRHLVMKFIGNGSSLLVRRDAAMAVGGFVAKGLGVCADLDFELRLMTHYKVDVAAEMLVGYRTHEDNALSGSRRMIAGITSATEICIAANPQLSSMVRRFARAQIYRFAAEKLARSSSKRMKARSSLAFFRIPLYDPALFIYLLYRSVEGAFSRATGTSAQLATGESRMRFADMAPAFDQKRRPRSPFWERRLGVLAEADAALEQVRFNSASIRPIMASRPLLHAGE